MPFSNAKTLVNRGIKRARNFLADPQSRANAIRAAKVLKFAHNYTKTKHKKRRTKIIHKDSAGKVMQTSAFVKGSKMTPKLRSKYADAYEWNYQYAASFGFTSGAGAGIDTSKYQISDLQSVYTGTALVGTLVPMAFSATSNSTGDAPVISQNTNYSVLCTNVKISLEMVNMAPSVTFVTLYIVKARDDTFTQLVAPSTAWETAVDNISGVTAGTGTPANVKSTWPFGRPTPNQSFKDVWTTVHTCDIDLDPGETRRHVVDIQINKERDWFDISQNTGCLKGITHYIFAATRGAPGDTSNTPALGTVMFCPHKIVGVCGIEQKGKVAIKTSKVLNQTSSISTAGAAALYTMNDDKGAADNVVTVNYG